MSLQSYVHQLRWHRRKVKHLKYSMRQMKMKLLKKVLVEFASAVVISGLFLFVLALFFEVI